LKTQYLRQGQGSFDQSGFLSAIFLKTIEPIQPRIAL
jgi:hypothetical protein